MVYCMQDSIERPPPLLRIENTAGGKFLINSQLLFTAGREFELVF